MSRTSNKSLKQIVHQPSKASLGGRNVTLPTIPSNLGPDSDAPEFNSIGYYGDLLGRLDSQIKTVEDVYKQTFMRVQHQTNENAIKNSGTKVYQLHELT